ncbi:MAG: PAS domain S-box protein [Elusimicrobiota bacterium]
MINLLKNSPTSFPIDLGQAHRSLQALLESAPVAIISLDLSGCVTSWNPAAEKMLGWSKKEVLSKPIPFVPADKKTEHFWLLASSLKNEIQKEIQITRLRKNQRLIHLSVSTAPLKSTAGKVEGVMMVFSDVTDKRKDEEKQERFLNQIDHERKRFSNLVSNIPGVVWESWDQIDISSQQLNFVSKNLKAITGYDEKDWFSSSCFWKEIVVKEDKKLAKEFLQSIRKNGEAYASFRWSKKNGQSIWVDLPGSCVYDTEKKPIGLRCIAFDVTDHKLTEAALKKSEQQLVQAQKMEAIGRLAGGVAHDFNNLLTAIIGYSEFLLSSSKYKNILDDVNEIKKTALRATDLTRQLLAFGRQQLLQPKMVHVNSVLLSLSKMLQRLIGEDVQLIIETEANLCPVFVDVGQMEQVIVNLVVNARDAMPKGGVVRLITKNISVKDSPPNIPVGAYVLLSVIDTGMGMSPEILKNIFEPFYTTKEQGKGTGLGLSTVYGIINQSQGHIHVTSRVGSGSQFDIYLPQQAMTVRPRKPKLKKTSNFRGSETILLVEDEESVRRLTKRLLLENGYTVIEASNGKEAFELFRQKTTDIDFLLTDLVMPFMGGLELARRLKRENKKLPILFMTGYTNDEVVKSDLIDDEIDLIVKPFSPSDLMSRIRLSLRRV